VSRSADHLIADCLRGQSAKRLLEALIEEEGIDWQSLRCDLLKDFDAIPVKPEKIEMGETTCILFQNDVYEANKSSILYIVEAYANVYHDIDFVIGREGENDE
jgi:hypothetical protein